MVQAVLVQFGMDAVQDNVVLRTVEKEGIFHNAKYILTPEDYKCLDGKTPVVKVASAGQNLMRQDADVPPFGLMIGECGVQYI